VTIALSEVRELSVTRFNLFFRSETDKKFRGNGDAGFRLTAKVR